MYFFIAIDDIENVGDLCWDKGKGNIVPHILQKKVDPAMLLRSSTAIKKPSYIIKSIWFIFMVTTSANALVSRMPPARP